MKTELELQLNQVNSSIEGACIQGKYMCYTFLDLRDEILNSLKKEGYVVVYFSDGYSNHHKIYWGSEVDNIRRKWWYKLGFYKGV